MTKDGDFFIANTHPEKFIGGTEKVTDKETYSGNHAIMLKKSREYGLSCNIRNTNSDEYYEASVWRKGSENKGSLVVSDDHGLLYYNSVNIPDSIGKDGWERLKLAFYVPPNFNNVTLKFYVWNPAEEAVYFDDLKISRKHHEQYPDYSGIDDLKLFVDTLESLKLYKKREQAFKAGILETQDDDWVEGMMFCGDDAYKINLRLKGDWLDHLLGKKWSFRIETDKTSSWKGMRTFSVQNPLSRYYLNEWLLLQFCHKEDILATRYGFIPLKYNNRSLGIYAWEEHFEKYLVESSNRREGPILKVNENALWKTQQLAIRDDRRYWLPIVSSAEILPFKSKRTTRDEVLFGQYKIAQELYHQYKFARGKASEIFDVDKLARYMAMIDLFGTYHGVTWHNQRFYYNPVLSKLEPVAFDNFSEKGPVRYESAAISGMQYIGVDKTNDMQIALAGLFRDTLFINAYVHYLKNYANDDFITAMLDELKHEIVFYDSLLRMEYETYRFSPAFLYENARAIREELPAFMAKLKENTDEMPAYSIAKPAYDKGLDAEVSKYFIKAYSKALDDEKRIIEVENHFTDEIIILGTAGNDKRIRNFIYPEVRVKAIEGRDPGAAIIEGASNDDYLFYMVDGDMDTYSIPVFPWPKPGRMLTPLQNMLIEHGGNYKDVFTAGPGNKLILAEGTYELIKPLIIPAGYEVIIEAGVTINLSRKAPFISYSVMNILGTPEKTVLIKSSDGTGNGFTVLQAPGRSVVKYTVFDRLNTLDRQGWTLTGAVTFYESAVDFYHTSFQNNLCEDGLNIIRSAFTIDQCDLLNTFSDALDVDFGQGSITNSNFSYPGNDGIDVSGSRISINHCMVTQSNDKAISAGENSQVEVMNTRISGSVIGMASKDQSRVVARDCSIEDSNYGLVVFRKKAEFGPASFVGSRLEMRNITTEFLVEEGSSCEVNGEKVTADKKNVYDLFYN
ncbi:MAG: CotH kinase family protein [Bacteroidales bacterium]|nr:CotH kinase family protein [Bacteroidales bacterium]